MNRQPVISGKTNNHVYGVGRGLCELNKTSHVEPRPHSLTYTRQQALKNEIGERGRGQVGCCALRFLSNLIFQVGFLG